jgi:hypothetical protein
LLASPQLRSAHQRHHEIDDHYARDVVLTCLKGLPTVACRLNAIAHASKPHDHQLPCIRSVFHNQEQISDPLGLR